jgi:short subunit dehydrogenase-like uncharacterized protein
MQQDSFLLYGANGYTGKLIARYAKQFNLFPILSGRRKEALEPLSKELDLPYKVFDLNDTKSLQAALREVKVVVHAAGPFQFTATQMITSCLETGTHYLDINGDISVFESLKQYDVAAKKAGTMVLPGAGFDVVPTDCTGLLLKKLLPSANELKLAFATLGGGLSHGTATTMVGKLGEKAKIRKGGEIVPVPVGHKGMWVDFGEKQLFVMTIPWGDISTAYFTTGIPNIETYAGVSPKIYKLLKLQPLFNWLLRMSIIRKWIKNKIDLRPPGPSDEMRSKANSFVWGQATNSKGQKATVRLKAPDGYTLTAYSTLIIAQKVLQGNFIPGYQTPASAYGEDLVLEIPGVKRTIDT